MAGAMNATPAELNLLHDAVFGGFESGDVLFFYMATAPTGWTRDTDTANMDGAGLMITTGTGGGAVGGTHDLDSPPSADHSHTDTFAQDGFALDSDTYMGSHYHDLYYMGDANDSTPFMHTTYGVYSENSGGTSNYKYDIDMVTADVLDVGRTSSTGSGSSHNASVSGSVTSSSQTAFAPKYINVMRAEKD
jgi:hypothetical protein